MYSSGVGLSFTKLFSSITDSTIWREPDHVRLVWITMLAASDARGRVFASIPGLADKSRVSVERCRLALTALASPDPDSRSKNDEGRRIVEIDGGWRLINYTKYREIRDEESIRASKRDWWNKNRSPTRLDTPLEQLDSTRPKKKQKQKNTNTPLTSFAEFWSAYPRKQGKGAAEKAFSNLQGVELETLLVALRTQARSEQWQKDGGKFIPFPATWLNQGRWQDEGVVLSPIRSVVSTEWLDADQKHRAEVAAEREKRAKVVGK